MNKIDKHTNDLVPLELNQRVEVMDVLRGFALCGIIFMNIEWFNRASVEMGRFDFQLTGVDWGSSWLVRLLIEGKFYRIFSLLFGMGFAVMLLQAKRKGKPFYWWFSRRMGVLFAIGLFHLIFIWGGDILHDYAIGGMMMLLWMWLLKFKWMQWANNEQGFLKVGLSILTLPFVVAFVIAVFFGVSKNADEFNADYNLQVAVEKRVVEIKQDELIAAPLIATAVAERNGSQKRPKVNQELMTEAELIIYKSERRFISRHKKYLDGQEQKQILRNGNYSEIVSYWAKNSLSELAKTPLLAGILSFPLFMIGYWFVISGVIVKPKEHIGLFKSMLWCGLGIGGVISAGSLIILSHPQLRVVRDFEIVANSIFMLGQSLMCAGYLAAIVLLAISKKTNKLVQWLSPMGKMALTNYLMQSVILAFIFFSYGLGLFGDVSRFAQMGIAVLVLALQWGMSFIWLKYYRFGPLEWLWRSLIYKQFQPLKLNN